MMTLPILTQVIGTLTVLSEQPPVREVPQEAGPSRTPIIVESSSSDEPILPVPKPRVVIPQTQMEEIRFKEVRSLITHIGRLAIIIG